jgi:hypothetical protein
LIIQKTLRDKRFTFPALKHLIDFVVRRGISLASYAGETSVSYHGRADRPDGCPAVTPSALTRICYTPAKKTYGVLIVAHQQAKAFSRTAIQTA